MPIPTVDEVWADFNSNGTVHEPAKQDIRRLTRFIQTLAEANGMKTYPNKAAMDADLTQPDGKPALLYADPAETNNYPTVWIWDDSGNEWIDGVDRISSLKTLVDLIHNVARRVVVLANEGIIDRLGQLGGGSGQIYIPRNVFIDLPGVGASNITVANADSTEKPGWAKLAIPATFRCFAYLDLVDNTYKIVAATGGDFALPTTPADKIVPIIDLGVPGSAGYWSPFRFRELSPISNLSAFAALSPIVHSKADNKALFPSGTIRSEQTLFAHTVPATGRYEEFDTASSNTAVITYWWDFRANQYKATAGGATPFTIDPTIGVRLGWSWKGEFFSEWPHIGIMGAGLGKNDFAWGKGDRLIQAPHVFNDNPSRLEMVDVEDAALIAAGFTRAIRTVDPALAWPFVGDRIPDNRPGKPIYIRVWLEAAVDNNFANPRVRFRKPDGVNVLSTPLTLEKTLSPRAAIFSVPLLMPEPSAVGGAGEFTVVDAGTFYTTGQPEVRVAGVQFSFGQGAQYIERNDFPTTPALAIRVANLEAQAAIDDPVPSILIGEDLWLIEGREQSIHIDNLLSTRTERKGVLTTLFAPNPDINNTAAKPYALTLESGSFVINPATIGSKANIWMHRYSDTKGGAALGRSYRSADITVHKASASGKNGAVTVGGSNAGTGTLVQGSPFVDPTATIGNYVITVVAGAETFSIVGPGYAARGAIGAAFDGPISFTLAGAPVANDTWTVAVTADTVRPMCIGDSIASQTLATYVRDILTARGMIVDMSGTVGPVGNEGRAGSTITDHIRARTSWLTPVTNWASYLGLPNSGAESKITFDPFTKAVVGGEPPSEVYNGRRFDFAYYLANTGINPPTHVWICLGTNDIAAYAAADAADWIEKGLTIMVNQILAAVPGVYIGIALPTLPRMGTADTRWNSAYGLAVRKLLKFKRTLNHARVKVLSIWTAINQVTSFASTEVVASTDPETGMQTLDNGDMLHPSQSGVHEYAEVVAAWIANTVDGT